MNTRTIRQLAILLPELDRDDLDPADPPTPGDTVTDAQVSDQSWRRAQVSDAAVIGARFDAADLTETRWERSSLAGCEFHNTDLTGATFTETTLDRCLIYGCRLTGASLTAVTLKNTLFEDCRLDYAVLHQLRTVGPAALLGCTLIETTLTGCQLTHIAIDNCRLRATELRNCDLRGADLRGTDLSHIRGATTLRGATIDHAQLPGLTTALAQDLELTIR